MRTALATLCLSLILAPGLLAQEPDLAALLEEAGKKLAAGDLEGARQGFEQAVAAEPQSAAAWMGLSEAFSRGGVGLQALAAVRRAQQLKPDSFEIVLALGRQLAGLGRNEQALEALGRARALDPQRPEPYVLAALLLRDSGQLAEAISVLEATAKGGVSHFTVARELALMLLADGRTKEAALIATSALEENEGRPGLHLAAGLALAADSASSAEAADHLAKAIELGVANPGRVRIELATLLTGLGRAEEALVHAEEAARLLPDTPQAYYALGTARRETGDGEGATAALARFQALTRERTEREERARDLAIALNEAQSLASAGKADEALARLGALLDENPAEDRALSLRAKIRFSAGQVAEALADVERAVSIAPRRIEYHYLAGLFLMRLGRLAEAESALLGALVLDPGLGEALYLLGGVAAKQGRPEQAIEYFQKAIELGADSPSLRLGYAGALEDLGRSDESQEQMGVYRQLKAEAAAKPSGGE